MSKKECKGCGTCNNNNQHIKCLTRLLFYCTFQRIENWKSMYVTCVSDRVFDKDDNSISISYFCT